ncbi:NAD(P)H-dependent oxidoreductase [Nocardia yunnanensis]|uniref:NAD(P)H-dependent oxidoreductase n=1 Tax=Nocardia yunnanensis TaxID=2382165 RepID=A0A386Z9L2_9NOCA|nr:NADPH-dependent FMN reductase [Nocardia yunnanensis]AYF74288.1 NAD(P)H-dependent oxidoreductase [Nocardia yunnanensis]
MTIPRLLLISGSTREGSTNSAALRTIAADAGSDFTADLYADLLALPPFVPGTDPEPVAVAELHRQLGAADAVLFCTPEYAGMIPGSLENLLEWTIGNADLSEKPVAYVNVAYEGCGEAAVATLRTVVGYAGAEIVEAACERITVVPSDIGPDGLVADLALRTRLAAAARALAKHAAHPAATATSIQLDN